MPPPQSIPVSASALTERGSQISHDKYKVKTTRSQKQHSDRSNFFKNVTAKQENKEINQYTALFKKPPSYGFAIDEAFPDEINEIVIIGKMDYDLAQAKQKAALKLQM